MTWNLSKEEVINTVSNQHQSIFQEASFSLAEAKFAAGGDFNQAVLQNVNKVRLYIILGCSISGNRAHVLYILTRRQWTLNNVGKEHYLAKLLLSIVSPRESFVQQHHAPQAQIKVKTKKDNVAGVNLPNFEAFQVLPKEQIHLVFSLDLLHIGRIRFKWVGWSCQGRTAVQEIEGLSNSSNTLAFLMMYYWKDDLPPFSHFWFQANYQKAINLLVELASLQTSFITLDEVIKTTNRRSYTGNGQLFNKSKYPW